MMTALQMLKDEPEDKPLHVAERMAAAIVVRMEEKGECRIAHLRALGFSLDDIARYWPQACKLVEARRPRVEL
jgi:hypothetical protein